MICNPVWKLWEAGNQGVKGLNTADKFEGLGGKLFRVSIKAKIFHQLLNHLVKHTIKRFQRFEIQDRVYYFSNESVVSIIKSTNLSYSEKKTMQFSSKVLN